MTRLIRNLGTAGTGKYSVIDNRTGWMVVDAEPWGRNEFFVLKLADRYSAAALHAYALAADTAGDHEYAADVLELAKRAGPASPHCKNPD